jgi:NodT family efflux transporter outer membrane factor (OMF) lipoprotein
LPIPLYAQEGPGMARIDRRSSAYSLALVASVLVTALSGCTGPLEYVRNGFKVGPNYKRPPAPIAEAWIDALDPRVRSQEPDDSHWWTVFNDPVLNDLVLAAYNQNLTLREAGYRVLRARAVLGVAVGELFPQNQSMNGDYTRYNLSREVANRQALPQSFYSQWDYGFNLAWELDFWGLYRRAVEADRDLLDASVENYDDAMVTLLSDVATNYVQYRIFQQQIAYARENVALQRISFQIAVARFKGGQDSEISPNQAQSDLSETESLIPQYEINLRQANDRLCVLLGIPSVELQAKLGPAPIPAAGSSVAVGIPAELLRRRPDIRRAEREAAAQCAQIGVAVAQLYPHISISGQMGWSAQNIPGLFAGDAFRGTVGPNFTWNILNYGRLLNNIREQNARFNELVLSYQNTVLKADQEVEDGLATFLRSQEQTQFLTTSVNAEIKAVKEAIAQYKGGLVDFNRVALIQERLVQRQEELAQAQGQIALGLIQVYRALGGGWQIRCDPQALAEAQAATMIPRPAMRDETLPMPKPDLDGLPPPKKDMN